MDDYSFALDVRRGHDRRLLCGREAQITKRVFPPLNTTDYSSYVQQLPAPSKVDGYFWVVGGTGTVPSLKAFEAAYGPLTAIEGDREPVLRGRPATSSRSPRTSAARTSAGSARPGATTTRRPRTPTTRRSLDKCGRRSRRSAGRRTVRPRSSAAASTTTTTGRLGAREGPQHRQRQHLRSQKPLQAALGQGRPDTARSGSSSWTRTARRSRTSGRTRSSPSPGRRWSRPSSGSPR